MKIKGIDSMDRQELHDHLVLYHAKDTYEIDIIHDAYSIVGFDLIRMHNEIHMANLFSSNFFVHEHKV